MTVNPDFWHDMSNIAQIVNSLLIVVLLIRVRRLQNRVKRLEGK